jgi:type I restriction enzyme R subunit
VKRHTVRYFGLASGLAQPHPIPPRDHLLILTLPYSEADTRQQLIDDRLRLAGWNVDDPSQVMQELALQLDRRAVRDPGRERAGFRFVDYALLLRGQPVAVIEAKKTTRDAQLGQEQAKQYAEQLQRRHGGPLPFILYTNGYDNYFWDSERYAPAKVPGFPGHDDLQWFVERREARRPLSVELIDRSIAGRDYQIEGIRTILDAIEHGRRKFLMGDGDRHG